MNRFYQNKNIKKIQTVIVVLFIFVTSIQGYTADLVFGTQNFPPFSYEKNGIVAGPGVQLIQAVCKEAELECTFKLGLWEGVQTRAKHDRAEINSLFFLGKNANREKWLYFSPPIVQTEYGFFVKQDDMISYSKKDINKLAGYNIGVYGPSNTEKNLKNIKDAGGAFAITIFKDSETTLRVLSFSNRLNMVFSNRDVGKTIIKQQNFANLKYAGSHEKTLYYIAFSKAKVNKKIKDKFIKSYKTLKSNGTINNILSNYKMIMVE